jgi:diamine N-acetyltransferase
MNLQRIELTVLSTNARAIRAYEKVGFRREGVLRRSGFRSGAHTDDHIMGLLAEELIDS